MDRQTDRIMTPKTALAYAYGPAAVTATHHLFIKIQNDTAFLIPASEFVLEKRLLNGCNMFICTDDIVNFVLCIGPVNDDGQPQASKVLMVLAVGITGHWRMPLAYCLTDGADANLQQSLITTVITKLCESSCLSISVTMDGNNHLVPVLFPSDIVTATRRLRDSAVWTSCSSHKKQCICVSEFQALIGPSQWLAFC